jgi:hypothetical protein
MIQSRKILSLHRREDVMTIRQINFVAGESFSRRQMDQMGMPIGNPHKPPFKQKEMPFFIAPAIAAAGTAFAAAGTAIAAGGVMASMGAIGTAALATVGAIGTIAAVAGTAMSVVGMVTGDKGLMKIGAIVGLAGGVASLASGAVASLAAGGEFAMGTAGIQSANAANATAAQAASLTAGVLPNANTAINGMLGQGSTQAAQSASNVTGGIAGGATKIVNPAMSPIQGSVTNFSPAINATGTQAGNAINSMLQQGSTQAANSAASSGGFIDKLLGSMTEKDYVIAGWGAFQGGSAMMDKNLASVNAQKEYEYKQAQINQRIANLNSVPTLRNTLDANAGLNANAGL